LTRIDFGHFTSIIVLVGILKKNWGFFLRDNDVFGAGMLLIFQGILWEAFGLVLLAHEEHISTVLKSPFLVIFIFSLIL